MKIKIIEEKEYLDFALNNKYISIYQLPMWGQLKEVTGWKSHLIGLYEESILKGVTLLLEKKLPIKKSLFYAPRGFLLDIDNKELLAEFTSLIKDYIKKQHGFMLKIDPNYIYAIYDQNKENKVIKGQKGFDNLVSLGYKHLGFTLNFETLQPRFLCRFKLEDTYEKTLLNFSKSTRKNIEKTEKMGVKVRLARIEEMDLFTHLLEETGKNKNFIVRPSSYYKKMYELMHDYMKLYITYIDTEEYYNYLINEINITNKEIDNIKKLMENNNVGNKLKNNLKMQEQHLDNLKKNLSNAKEMRKTSSSINIGALMSLFIGDEGITFMSGTSSVYKSFNPKYAFYNAHIKDCLKENKKYCNFYGISGDMDKNSPYYAIYEIKKGFNPDIIELIGEFDLIIDKFTYVLYKIAMKGYKILKKIKKG